MSVFSSYLTQLWDTILPHKSLRNARIWSEDMEVLRKVFLVSMHPLA